MRKEGMEGGGERKKRGRTEGRREREGAKGVREYVEEMRRKGKGKEGRCNMCV